MKNKLVIITGASSGIGKACAEKFAQEGANLVLAARSSDKLREVAENIERNGVQVLPVITDVSIEEDCKRLIKSAIIKISIKNSINHKFFHLPSVSHSMSS